MKTVQTKPDCTLGFVNIPEFEGVPDEEFINKFLDFFKNEGIDVTIDEILGIKEMKIVIGKLSEITEEQARQLVENIFCPTELLEEVKGQNIVYKAYGPLPFTASKYFTVPVKEVYPVNAIDSLYSAALSVGIEEKDFNKYLVIKL